MGSHHHGIAVLAGGGGVGGDVVYTYMHKDRSACFYPPPPLPPLHEVWSSVFFFQDSLYNFISRFLTVNIIFFRFFLRISHRSWMRWLLTVVRPRILQTWKYIAMILTSHPYKETVRFTALRCISVPIVQTLPPINFSHKSWTWKATFQP